MICVATRSRLLAIKTRHNCRIQSFKFSSTVSSLPSQQSESTNDYDIVINGGGIVGLAFTALINQLTHGSLKIAIYGAPEVGSLKNIGPEDPPHTRVYALSPSSIDLLKKVQAWDQIELRSQPYQAMQVWDANGPGLIKFRSSEIGAKELGRIVEDDSIVHALLTTLQSGGIHARTVFIRDSKISQLELPQRSHNGGLAVIKDSNGKKLQARLLIGADGAVSFVRSAAGMGSFGKSYGQLGVVGTVKLTEGESQRSSVYAWQRYLGDGPIALLPLWKDYASIVWSVSVPEGRRLLALSEEEWIQEVNNALQSPRQGPPFSSSSSASFADEHSSSFPPWLSTLWSASQQARGELRGLAMAAVDTARLMDPPLAPPLITSAVGSRLSFPLQFQQASAYVAPRVALIGDAAHSIHPQAGQGLNLGLQDVNALAAVVTDAISTGSDFGLESVLKAYERQRYPANLAMLSGVDMLHSLFQDRDNESQGAIKGLNMAKKVVRTAGLLGLQALGGSVRSTIIKAASEGVFSNSQSKR